jgi:hypothetical protein
MATFMLPCSGSRVYDLSENRRIRKGKEAAAHIYTNRLGLARRVPSAATRKTHHGSRQPREHLPLLASQKEGTTYGYTWLHILVYLVPKCWANLNTTSMTTVLYLQLQVQLSYKLYYTTACAMAITCMATISEIVRHCYCRATARAVILPWSASHRKAVSQ